MQKLFDRAYPPPSTTNIKDSEMTQWIANKYNPYIESVFEFLTKGKWSELMIILLNIGQKQGKDLRGRSVLVDGFLLNGKLTGPGTFKEKYGTKWECNYLNDELNGPGE